MKDFRFTGTISGDPIDITFRTDAINSNDENFSVMQIQTGSSFSPNDINSSDHDKHLGLFKQLPYNLSTFKAFAVANGLILTSANSDGSNQVSISALED